MPLLPEDSAALHKTFQNGIAETMASTLKKEKDIIRRGISHRLCFLRVRSEFSYQKWLKQVIGGILLSEIVAEAIEMAENNNSNNRDLKYIVTLADGLVMCVAILSPNDFEGIFEL